jgi:dGTPase
VKVLGNRGSTRISRMVHDVVVQTGRLGLAEVRMSDEVLEETLRLRQFLFNAVYENTLSTAEFRKAADILGELWQKVHERPLEFLDRETVEKEGPDAAARDFLAGMTDLYAVALFEKLFIPKPWVNLNRALEERTE